MTDIESFRRTGCIGKHKHETMDAALRQLAKGKKNNRTPMKGVKLSAYKCPFCDSFHIGHDLANPKK